MADRGDATSVAVRTDDWPAHATETIVRTVDSVRSKTTGPALTVARGVVYGLVAGVLGVAALVLLTALLVRFLDAYLPDSVFGERHTWAVYLILGVVCTTAGAVLWSRRHKAAEE